MSETEPDVGAELEKQANELFFNGEYSQAYDKYSDALKVDGDDALLYANRAACSLALGRYLDATSDARRAADIDPDYAKAWGHLAAAERELGNWERALGAYERALSRLPKENVTDVEKELKEEYEKGHSEVKKILETKKAGAPVATVGPEVRQESPFQRAKAIFRELEESGRKHELVFSSVNTIYIAGTEFEAAVEAMREWKIQDIDGERSVYGRLDVLDKMSNAVLIDRRSFYIDGPRFIDDYNKHLALVTSKADAWDDDGPETVLEEAQKRIQEGGWDNARRAIAATVRGWIMRAFMGAGLNEDYIGAEQFYRNAIDVIERGQKLWADVPKEQRGIVFETTFLFGVRSLHLEAFRQAHTIAGESDARFSAERLDELATELIRDVEKARSAIGEAHRQSTGEGFYLALFVYPAAEAGASKAYALRRRSKDSKPEEAAQLWGESAEFYTLAAKLLPRDDEYFCQNLMNALASWWLYNDPPLKITLPLLNQLKQSVPKMKRIWEYSQLAMDGRDTRIQKCLDYYEEVLKKLEEGTLTENDSYNPSFQL